MRTRKDLLIMQSLPLNIKERMSESRVIQWISEMGDSYVSFSGGKDSTVLKNIVEKVSPDTPSVYCDTGLEYPEIKQFVKSFNNVEIIRPTMSFNEVITRFGYPFISKEVAQNVYECRKYGEKAQRTLSKFDSESELNKKYKGRFSLAKWKPLLDIDFELSHICCKVMKKDPFKKYEKRTGRTPIVATMAEESSLRESIWLKNGCNAFTAKRPRSAPMSFWREQDVLEYLKIHSLPYASVYGQIVYKEYPEQIRINSPEIPCDKLCTTGCKRTGCVFCGFGAHRDEKSRFVLLKETHRKLYDYCMGGGAFCEGVWKPTNSGLGMAYVIDQLNRIYGKDFIKY